MGLFSARNSVEHQKNIAALHYPQLATYYPLLTGGQTWKVAIQYQLMYGHPWLVGEDAMEKESALQ